MAAVYCSIQTYLRSKHRKLYEFLDDNCLLNFRCSTFVVPNEAYFAEIQKLYKIKGSDKSGPRKAAQMIKALQIQGAFVKSPRFQPGKYTNGNNQIVEISAGTSGTFEIRSGKDLATTAKVKLEPNFEPEWKFGKDEDKEYCVVHLVSGSIAIDGDRSEGIMQPSKHMQGGSEFVAGSPNVKLEHAHSVISGIRAELELKRNVTAPAVVCAGLLKHILNHKDSIPEYDHVGKLIHTTVCYEPFAMWYILVQPFSEHQFMPRRLNSEWGFGVRCEPDFCGLWDQFCSAFPCCIDKNARSALIAEVKSADGKIKASEVQDVYSQHCQKMFAEIPNYPCEQKLWADEVCFYITARMCEIRKNHSVSEFDSLMNTLRESFPGKDHARESIFGDEKYWKNIALKHNLDSHTGLKAFAESSCFMKCCPCDCGSEECKSCLQSCSGCKLSDYLKSIIKLNSDLV